MSDYMHKIAINLGAKPYAVVDHFIKYEQDTGDYNKDLRQSLLLGHRVSTGLEKRGDDLGKERLVPIAEKKKYLDIITEPDNLRTLQKIGIDFDKDYLPWYMSQIDYKYEIVFIVGYFLKKKQYDRVHAILDLCGSKQNLRKLLDDSLVAELFALDTKGEFWTIDKMIRPLIKTKALSEGTKNTEELKNLIAKEKEKKSILDTCVTEARVLEEKIKKIEEEEKSKGSDKKRKIKETPEKKELGKRLKHFKAMEREALNDLSVIYKNIAKDNLPTVLKAINLFMPDIYSTPEDESLFALLKEKYSRAYESLLTYVVNPALAAGRGESECIACRYFGVTKSLKKRRSGQEHSDESFWRTSTEESGINYEGEDFSQTYPFYNLCSNDKDGLHKLLIKLIDEGKVRKYPPYSSLSTLFRDKVGSDIEIFTHDYLYKNGLSYLNIHSRATINSNKKIFLREVKPSAIRNFRYDFYIPKIRTFIEVQGEKFHGHLPTLSSELVNYFNLISPEELSEALAIAENILDQLHDIPRNRKFFEDAPEEKKVILGDFKKLISVILDAFKNDRDSHPQTIYDIPLFKEHIDAHGLDDLLAIAKTAATIAKSDWATIKKITESIEEGSKLLLKDRYKRYIVENKLSLRDYFAEGKYHLIELHQHHFEMSKGTCDAERILNSRVFKPLGITPRMSMSRQLEFDTLEELYKKYKVFEE